MRSKTKKTNSQKGSLSTGLIQRRTFQEQSFDFQQWEAQAEKLDNKTSAIAYFSMEIAVDPAIPTYSGGLGILAGDTGYPIDSVTNAVHAATWTSMPFCRLYDKNIPAWRRDNLYRL